MVMRQVWAIILLLLGSGYALAAKSNGNSNTSTISKPTSTLLMPAYPSKSGACYVLLRPIHKDPMYVESSDAPVCRAFLDNFNKFCGEPPQYERRKLHPSTTMLREPKWEALDVQSNPDLVREIYGSVSLPKYREERWKFEGEKVMSLAASNLLRLWRADIDTNLRLGKQRLYMLENSQLGDPLGYNQPRLMFSERGREHPSELFDLITYSAKTVADLWRFGTSWYLVRYEIATEKWFTVNELVRSRSGPEAPVVASTICSIQHINDRQGGK